MIYRADLLVHLSEGEGQILKDLEDSRPTAWINTKRLDGAQHHSRVTLPMVEEAEARLQRFRPFLKQVFPQLEASDGLIESELKALGPLKSHILPKVGFEPAEVFMKLDSHLPISGSIKARGGIYEVLKQAETLALEANLLSLSDNYEVLALPSLRSFFSQFEIAVGSTGNLGLSIGIISAAIGFKVTVHMSSDAKQWKKDLLRSKGVAVVEYASDYSVAVEEGRRLALQNPKCHFIDDENSLDLFVGYATAGLRLRSQLEAEGIFITEDRPLFVYLPCGVGGGPGGVAWGLSAAFGDHVYPVFAEPVESPCVLLGMMTGQHEAIAVSDIGLSNKTIADGLAVGRPSGFVGREMEALLLGAYTVTDTSLLEALKQVYETMDLQLEPSALAGFEGPKRMYESCKQIGAYTVARQMEVGVHVLWATGGSMVPQEVFHQYLTKGNL